MQARNRWQPFELGVFSTSSVRDWHIVKRLQRIEKKMSGNARATFAAYIPNGDMGAYAKKLPSALRDGFTTAMELLRNKDFPAESRWKFRWFWS
jgi:hypothetical protein